MAVARTVAVRGAEQIKESSPKQSPRPGTDGDFSSLGVMGIVFVRVISLRSGGPHGAPRYRWLCLIRMLKVRMCASLCHLGCMGVDLDDLRLVVYA